MVTKTEPLNKTPVKRHGFRLRVEAVSRCYRGLNNYQRVHLRVPFTRVYKDCEKRYYGFL